MTVTATSASNPALLLGISASATHTIAGHTALSAGLPVPVPP